MTGILTLDLLLAITIASGGTLLVWPFAWAYGIGCALARLASWLMSLHARRPPFAPDTAPGGGRGWQGVPGHWGTGAGRSFCLK